MKRFVLLTILIALVAYNRLSAYYHYGQNKVNTTLIRWSQIETTHFDIYFPAGNDNFGRLAALMAEETYYYLKRDFRFPAVSRISIIFYSSKQEFQTTNIIYPLLSEGVGGFYESLRNRVVIPFDGCYAKLEEVLTHELSHAYLSALDRGSPGSFFYLRNLRFPFWFSEGLAEFQAVGGTNSTNNAFMLDLVLNDRLRPINEAAGYSAYRMGESFLVFQNNRYGREKVMDFLYTLRAVNDLDKASKRVFNLSFKDLEQRWRNQLKRDYFPFIQTHTLPNEYSSQKTRHREDGSFFNLAPRFSPDGQKYIYFSNRCGRYSIWSGGIFEFSENKKIITGEATGSMEEFHYLRSNLSWFPDSKRFAYVAKTSFGDMIYIADYDKREIVEEIHLSQFKAIYELDVSPDGKSLVFVAQRDMKSDLFLYSFESGEVKQLSNDHYDDMQPRFSPDGKSVAFTSARTRAANDIRKGFFSNLVSDIFVLSLSDSSLTQVTFDDFNNSHPVWDSLGTRLLFISDRQSVPNLEIIDATSGERTVVTQTLSGIYGFDLNYNNNYLVYSCFFDGGWDIYLKTGPMQDLQLEAQTSVPEIIEPDDSLLKSIDLSRLDYFGRKNLKKPVTDGGPHYIAGNPYVFDFRAGSDSVRSVPDFSHDDMPDSVYAPVQIKPYRLKFRVDSIFGGLAYSSSIGTIGNLELGLSDIMGNHNVGINLGIAGRLKDSNILLTYLYLARRIDHGFGVFNLFDEVNYYYYDTPTDIDYSRNRTQETGLYYLMRYPFNRFVRLDFRNLFFAWDNRWDFSEDGINYRENYRMSEKDYIYAASTSLVHDNTLYGATGPMLGYRANLTMSKSFAMHGNDYHTAYMDLRSYTLFSRRYSFAMRLVGGISGGNEPRKFNLSGYYGVRGYNDADTEGRKISMASAEIRFPFLDYFSMAFPLPLTITNLRGSLFTDIGAVWNDDKDFVGMRNDRLRDLHLGLGFGPRLNIGFAVLKLDIAWLTDLVSISKPSYYLSLTEDF